MFGKENYAKSDSNPEKTVLRASITEKQLVLVISVQCLCPLLIILKFETGNSYTGQI